MLRTYCFNADLFNIAENRAVEKCVAMLLSNGSTPVLRPDGAHPGHP